MQEKCRWRGSDGGAFGAENDGGYHPQFIADSGRPDKPVTDGASGPQRRHRAAVRRERCAPPGRAVTTYGTRHRIAATCEPVHSCGAAFEVKSSELDCDSRPWMRFASLTFIALVMAVANGLDNRAFGA